METGWTLSNCAACLCAARCFCDAASKNALTSSRASVQFSLPWRWRHSDWLLLRLKPALFPIRVGILLREVRDGKAGKLGSMAGWTLVGPGLLVAFPLVPSAEETVRCSYTRSGCSVRCTVLWVFDSCLCSAILEIMKLTLAQLEAEERWETCQCWPSCYICLSCNMELLALKLQYIYSIYMCRWLTLFTRFSVM